MALVRAVTALREDKGFTNQELVERAGMSASYYYTRLRGDAPFDTNDIEHLASALGTHPHEISRVAASYGAGSEDIEPGITTEPKELGRRLKALSASPRGDGSDFEEAELLQDLASRGIAVDAGEWASLIDGRSAPTVRTRLLEGVAEYASVPAAYLTELSDADALDAAEAQFEFRLALRESGAESVSARAVDGVSPAALRAIAQSLRSISPS
jgi:Helix-turn-helix domain